VTYSTMHDWTDNELDAGSLELNELEDARYAKAKAAKEKELGRKLSKTEDAELIESSYLTPDEFQEVGEIAFTEFGGDVKRAFKLAWHRIEEEEQEADEMFNEARAILEKAWGHKWNDAEVKKVRAEWDKAELDVAEAWMTVYGERLSDEEITQGLDEFRLDLPHYERQFEEDRKAERERFDAQLQAEREKTGSYSPQRLENHMRRWEEENKPDPARIEKLLRRSGRGEFDLDDAAEREKYLDSLDIKPEGNEDEKPEAVELPSDDKGIGAEAVEYIDARFQGAAPADVPLTETDGE
jgi:hypothetical protein